MYADIGGMDIQKQEVREAVELPLTHFELYKQVRCWKEIGHFLYSVWQIFFFIDVYTLYCERDDINFSM